MGRKSNWNPDPISKFISNSLFSSHFSFSHCFPVPCACCALPILRFCNILGISLVTNIIFAPLIIKYEEKDLDETEPH